MKYYFGLIDGDYGFVSADDPRKTDDFIEISEEYHQQLLDEQSEGKEIVLYDGQLFTAEPNRYYVDENNQWQKRTDEEWAEFLKTQNRNRLDMLMLTAADVERAIYKAKGLDFEDILEFVKDNPAIDVKALKIEFKANNFYRGNPYINQVGALLGYSPDDLDYLFVNKSLPVVNNSEPSTEKNPDVEPVTDDVIVNNENDEGK